MAELKTKLNNASVEEFLNGVADEKRRAACFTVSEIMREATGEEPKMWGPAIVGFGSYRYKYASGRAGDWMLIGLSREASQNSRRSRERKCENKSQI